MSASLLSTGFEASRLRLFHENLCLRSGEAPEFVDLTERVEDCVRRSGIEHGIVSLQCRHTSAAVVVNENEPLLLEDFAELLERLAPRRRRYHHDRFDLRTVNLAPDERPNGHAHARALLLGGSQSLALVGGHLELGRWQRVFLVELDAGRHRSVSVTILGAASTAPPDSGDGLPLPGADERRTA